jgi:archaetidylinositol phosphate synthase
MLAKIQRHVEGFFASSSSAFHAAGFSPNRITFVGFVLILGSALFYVTGLSQSSYWAIAVVLLLAAAYFDAMDGAMARRYKHVSRVGGVLDSVLDRLGEIFLYAAFALGGLTSFPIAIWALSASLMVSYVRARVEVEGVTLKGVGIAERPERILIVLVATLTFPFSQQSISWGTLLVAVLSTVTVIQRIHGAWKMLPKLQ